MFVPIHHTARRMKGTKGDPRQRIAAIVAISLVAALGGLASTLTKQALHSDRTAGVIVLVAIAVGAGFGLARAIGKQGKI
jgi:hypothetical protein